MSYLGDIRLGDTIDFKFTTRQISGAPSTLGGTPVVSAYVGNSTTQITAGITLTVDFDAVTGLNNVRVVATSGNGYATASNYDLVITTGTVNSVSVVGEVVGQFSIENRSAVMPTTAGRTLDVSAGGEAGVDWANVGSPTTAVNLSATTTNLVNTATTLTNLPAITANWLTAAGIAAGALDGKGNWNIGKTGYTLTATTGLGNQTADITGSLSGSVGSVTGAVGSVTGNVGGNVVGTVAGVTPATAAQVAAVLTTQITEAYRANGAAPTLAQFMSEVLAHLGEASISGTTKTIKQLDHSTTAETFTLDDATNPSSITRAS